MRQIGRLHLEFPFAGARMLRRLLAANGSKAGGYIKTLMRRMGIEALTGVRARRSRSRGTGLPRSAERHGDRAAELGLGVDITYIRMAKGFVYLAAVLDGSRGVCCRGGSPSRWKPRSASRRWRRHSPGTGSRRSSTRIRAASSRVQPSPACSARMRWISDTCKFSRLPISN